MTLFGLDNIEDFGARNLDKSLMRWWGVDEMSEKYSSFSPYNYVVNNPLINIDPDGKDWYKNSEGAVIFDKKITNQGDLDNAGISGSYLNANKYDKSVLDAIGSHILNSGDKAFNVFLSYQDNEILGDNYFIKAATINYNTNASGLMQTLTNNYQSVEDAILVSQMTHEWVGNAGWTSERNQAEHNIGMFILSDKYGPQIAQNIGWANEIRGLVINDRQSGNMLNSLLGRPSNRGGSTAFEWNDVHANHLGIRLWYKHRNKKDPIGMNAIPFSP